MMEFPHFFRLGATYAERMARSTEANPAFHYASLLTVVGAAIGRRLYLPYNHKLFPNLYTCLVGASGLSRKSTAIRLALGTVEGIEYLTGLSSMEGLLKRLEASGGELLVVLEELSSLLLKAKKQEYAAAIIPKLAELYDSPAKVDLPTKVKPVTVLNPFVAVLSATTPEWLEQSLDMADIMGGFANRFLFILGEPQGYVSNPGLPDYSGIVTPIAEALAKLPDGETELELDADASELWSSWYQAWMKELATEDEVFRVLAIRIPEFVLKATIIVHTLEGYGTLIGWESLQAAIQFVTYAHQCLRDLRPMFSPLELKVLRIIEKAGPEGVYPSRLHETLGGRVTGSELHTAIRSLVRFKRISEVKSDSGERLVFLNLNKRQT